MYRSAQLFVVFLNTFWVAPPAASHLTTTNAVPRPLAPMSAEMFDAEVSRSFVPSNTTAARLLTWPSVHAGAFVASLASAVTVAVAQLCHAVIAAPLVNSS